MLFKFLNVSKGTELRLRRRKAQQIRMSKRNLAFLATNRVRRFEESLSVEKIVAEVLEDCVKAVSKVGDRIVTVQKRRTVPIKRKGKESRKRRRHNWSTWLQHSYAIFMILHPEIFNGNVEKESESLGIARSTLQGWISTNIKKNCVPKWYDIIRSLTWDDVKKNYSKEVVSKFKAVDGTRKLKLSKFSIFSGQNAVLSKFSGVPAAKR